MIRAAAIAAVLFAGILKAQISGVVLDPSNAAVPGAPIALRKNTAELTTTTDASGRFRFNEIEPGSYELSISVSGFEPVKRTIRAPARPLTIHLSLAARKETVSVPGDELSVSTDAGRNADVISVERSLLDTLPTLDNNYLEALARFLSPGTPGDAGTTLIVDAMEMRNAGVTPSAIQEIRINNNPYTVEYPRWSRRRIEIITKSSADVYHGTANLLFRDHHLNARDALAFERPREQRRIFEGSLFGPFLNRKNTSFLLSGAREENDLVYIVFARGLLGPINQNVPAPQVNTQASLRITHQLNDRHAVFWQVNFQDWWRNNAGTGGTVPQEAGTNSRFREDELVFNHRGVLTPKLLSQFRILLGRFWSPTRSNTLSPKFVVTDAFTGGGAQADRLNTEFHTSITWLLTHTIRRHTLKYGVNVPDWSRRGLRDETDRRGTFYFASLSDYAAFEPFAVTAQRGDARLIFIERNLGGFFQDEFQLRPNLSIAAGARYDWQNYFGDRDNFAPRLAVAWAPGRSRKWVVRSGAGFFFERSGPQPIADVLRFDGTHLRRYVLTGNQITTDLSPLSLARFPFSIHRFERGIRLPDIMQFSLGVERQLRKKTLLSIAYNGTRGVQHLRSRDANAPLPPSFSARPDPAIGLLRTIESAGRFEGNTLEITVRGDLAPKVNGLAQYAFGRMLTDTGGMFWYPANSFAPRGEWGRSEFDRRHQFNLLGTITPHRWLNLGASLSLLSGIPFNITTGRDDNHDGMALDRPAGLARNTGRGPGFIGIDLRWYRDFRFDPSKKEKSPTLTLAVDAFNLPNCVNYQNYVGALTSPFFGRAAQTQPSRRLQLSARFQF